MSLPDIVSSLSIRYLATSAASERLRSSHGIAITICLLPVPGVRLLSANNGFSSAS